MGCGCGGGRQSKTVTPAQPARRVAATTGAVGPGYVRPSNPNSPVPGPSAPVQGSPGTVARPSGTVRAARPVQRRVI